MPVLVGKNSGANVTGPEFFLHEPALPGIFLARTIRQDLPTVCGGTGPYLVPDPSSADGIQMGIPEMLPNHGCLPAPNPQHRLMDLPVFQKKTIGVPVPERTSLFSGHSSHRGAPDFGTDDRLSNFCAFSPAAKEHGFFLIKTGIFEKQRFKRRISGGVGTISTAEFFWDLAS